MLGNSRMVSIPQIEDCLSRGWIVVVPNHRLCPGVDILEGPVEDCRDLLEWVYDGGLEGFLHDQGVGSVSVDAEKVMAFGTSSGGFLALSLVRFSFPSLLLFLYFLFLFCRVYWVYMLMKKR